MAPVWYHIELKKKNSFDHFNCAYILTYFYDKGSWWHNIPGTRCVESVDTFSFGLTRLGSSDDLFWPLCLLPLIIRTGIPLIWWSICGRSHFIGEGSYQTGWPHNSHPPSEKQLQIPRQDPLWIMGDVPADTLGHSRTIFGIGVSSGSSLDTQFCTFCNRKEANTNNKNSRSAENSSFWKEKFGKSSQLCVKQAEVLNMLVWERKDLNFSQWENICQGCGEAFQLVVARSQLVPGKGFPTGHPNLCWWLRTGGAGQCVATRDPKPSSEGWQIVRPYSYFCIILGPTCTWRNSFSLACS